ncbi:MAG TPA: hypothetical protein DEA71_15590 [Nitrospira sp.]|nr:hypothetical protein [Nitrospira sp.]
MFLTSRYQFVATMGLVLSLTSCADREFVIRPPAPERLPSLEHPIRGIADSVINVPVRVDMSGFLDAVNNPNLIPKKFDHWGSVIKHPKGADYKYYAERDDFSMERSAHSSRSTEPGLSIRDWWKDIDLSGGTLFVSAPLRYKIGARLPSQSTDSAAQCGDGTNWPKHATLDGSVAIGMTPNYSVSGSLRSVTVHSAEPCTLRSPDLDLQQVVNAALSDQVKGGFDSAVSRLNTLSVKSRAEDVWAALRHPIQLEPDTWLLLNPDKVKQTGFSKEGHVVTDTLHITARPVIVHGDEPPASSTALPQLETQASSPDFRGVADVQKAYPEKRSVSEKFHALADIRVDYSTLSQTLSNRLRGRRVENKGHFVTITAAGIFGLGENQVLLRVEFTGDARGYVYLIGKPEFNPMTQAVYLSGLRYDRGTTHLLQTTAPDWFTGAPFQETLAPEIALGVTPMIDRIRDSLRTGLNRTLTPTVSIQGTVTSMQGIAVFADVDALYVRAMSSGTLNVIAGSEP